MKTNIENYVILSEQKNKERKKTQNKFYFLRRFDSIRVEFDSGQQKHELNLILKKTTQLLLKNIINSVFIEIEREKKNKMKRLN